ncbi:MAG: hypothetical protein LHV69_11100 [Elusimicrobia bacterium]|nr:hypothetical protein [Candidatus Obscuribacterium magneticum]
MADEAQILLDKFLKAIRKNEKIREGLAYTAVVCLAALMLYFAWGLIPRRYTLKVTGGEILGNRHYFVEMLKESAYKKGLDLVVIPTKGSIDSLDEVDKGDLDLALIQGGLEDRSYRDVRHVCTVMPEILHLMVKPGIETIKHLSGKSVNVGPELSGTNVVANKVLSFSGLHAGNDYIERHYSIEELAGLYPSKLPDAIFLISTIPSFVAERLVRDNGYKVLEIPFPKSLALRYGWVVDEQILAYTYSIIPPEPDRDIVTVGVNVHVVANRKTDGRAISQKKCRAGAGQQGEEHSQTNGVKNMVNHTMPTLPNGRMKGI